MDGTLAALEQTFRETVNAFNEHKIEDLAKHLHDDITVYSINGQKRNHPKENARAYFIAQFKDNPNFEWPPNSDLNSDLKITLNYVGGKVTSATIDGTTTWKDVHGTEPLHFHFTCVHDGNRWLFKKVAAA
jgi:hypothetical protein